MTNDRSFNCLPAMTACVALCQTTQLEAADYYITDTFTFDRSGCVLAGAPGAGRDVGVGVPASMGMAGGTRVILTGPKVVAATVFQFGKTSGAADDAKLTRNAYVRDILFARDCSNYKPRPSITPDPIDCVKGVIMSFMNRCGMENVCSFDNPVGFHYFGVVASYARDCDATRTTPASNPKHDYWIGHLVGGYDINFGYVGANASFYLRHPTCYDEKPEFDLSIGIRLFGNIADTFIDEAEVGRINIGIEIDGRNRNGDTISAQAGPGAHQDVRLSNCVIDAVSTTGLQIRNLNRSGQISINDVYAAGSGSNLTALSIFDIDRGASIDIMGGKLFGDRGTGIKILNASSISIRGLYVRDFSTPMALENTAFSIIEPKIHNLSMRAAAAALTARNSTRNSYRPQISGAKSMFPAGIALITCNNSTIDPTMIDGDCLANESGIRVSFNGKDARSTSAFSASGNKLMAAASE